MSRKTTSSAVMATTLTLLLGIASDSAAATFVLASKATLTTRLRTTGWTPGDKPDLIWKDITLGNLPAADSAGNIDVSLGNLDSRVASLAVGDTLTLQLGGMSVSLTLALDPGRFAFVAPGGLNQGPLVNVITNTELAAAGFAPSLIDLVMTSANARIINTSSIFDPFTDAITTTSFFDLFELGPVFGTYRIEGVLSNVADLDTGEILAPFSVSAEFTDQIGTIVPEPSTLLLLGTGAVLGLARRRRSDPREGTPMDRGRSVSP